MKVNHSRAILSSAFRVREGNSIACRFSLESRYEEIFRVSRFSILATRYFTNLKTTLFPGSPLLWRRRPWSGWSRVTRISRDKFQIYCGRGGRGACVSCLKMLRLEIRELVCFCFVFATRILRRNRYAHPHLCNDIE